jgi:rhodanese-related sulfurtransferase
MTIFIIILLLLIGWDAGWYLAGVKPLFPWQLKKMLKGKTGQLALIDVRTPWEYSWFHLRGAVNKPELLFDINALGAKSTEAPLIVICMTGHRSPMVAYQLKKRGYKQVYNLTWGMLVWKLFGGKTQ